MVISVLRGCLCIKQNQYLVLGKQSNMCKWDHPLVVSGWKKVHDDLNTLLIWHNLLPTKHNSLFCSLCICEYWLCVDFTAKYISYCEKSNKLETSPKKKKTKKNYEKWREKRVSEAIFTQSCSHISNIGHVNIMHASCGSRLKSIVVKTPGNSVVVSLY